MPAAGICKKRENRMMEYRKLPRGSETLSTLGLGMGGIQNAAPEEIEETVSQAIAHGIRRCPFRVRQQAKMQKIRQFFEKGV